MKGPKSRINEKDMEAIDFSVHSPGGQDAALEAKKKEFLGGDDDDLK
jgi:hypothetical protein